MFVLRILGIATLVVVVACLLAYLVTREPRYLRFAGKVFRGALLIALLLFGLLILERLAVIRLPI